MAKTRFSHHCSGPIDRRTWLKIGGLSLGALCTGAPHLSQLLASHREDPTILIWDTKQLRKMVKEK